MKKLLNIATGLALLLSVECAHAVPSFARQTGLSCNVCHSNPPELTAFGRNFKLKGYVLTDMTATDKVGNSKDLLLSKYIPLSAMMLLSNTTFQSNQPASQNNAAGFPQQLSIFLAGGFTTLSATSGLTLNNNPTVEDLWNSTPAWGFPWISTSSGVDSLASPIINGSLGQDVAGVGGYSMWNNHLYTAVTVYRSEHAGASTPVAGTGQAYNISGVAPYWRAAWQQSWGSNYLEVGTYGIYVKSFPNAVSGPEDTYLDPSIDFQYERPFGPNLLDIHGTYIHENSNLDATYLAGGASTKTNHLNTFKLDSTYHWANKYSATGALFSTTGNGDPLLYAPAPLTGSNNGNPDTSGYIAQFAYWPVQNIDINVNYSGYFKFNGASANYDGAQRNASDNNTLYLALWVNF